MQPSVVSMEESEEATIIMTKANRYRVFPQRLLLRLLVPFLLFCFAFSFISICLIRYLAVHETTQPVALGGSSSIQTSCGNAARERNLEYWIRPPPSYLLLHNMTDTELFWRASFVPQIKEYPLLFSRVPKIAFLFLTRGPLPLAPLWERFFDGHEGLYSIYIHTLPSFQLNFSSSSVFYTRQIPSQITEWGMMNICDAERRLVANALLDIWNERFVLVSESCIPLYNFSFVYQYITRSKHSFMGAFDDPSPEGRGRYNSNMEPEVYIAHWRKGAQWFEINRKLAIYIIQDNKFYPKFLNFCKPYECFPDEHYFPTMLTIRAADLLANRSLTWTDWSTPGPHPATFGEADVTEEFLKERLGLGLPLFKQRESSSCVYNDQTTSVCFLFARKFAPSALDSLLLLAPKYFGYGLVEEFAGRLEEFRE